MPPGASTSRQRHLYEEVFFVLSGQGSTTFELADGTTDSFEWGPGSLFSLPVNVPYRLFNGSGQEPARIASTNNLCVLLNLFHSEAFIFDNDWNFADRQGEDRYYHGEGAVIPAQRGRVMWETNFIPDLNSFELRHWHTRGAGSSNMVFCLADGTMHAHCSEMSVGTYKKAHRHGPDFHVFIVSGQGYSLFWYEGDKDFIRFDWKPGCVFAPTDMIYHQHFNTSAEPARYMAAALGSTRYPFSAEKRALKMGVDVNVRDGGRQIEYEDQDPRIHRLYLEELAKKGIASRMGEFMDESVLLKAMG